MTELIRLSELRRPPTPGHKDLRAWKFQGRWSHDDSSTVLAWANDHACVFHEALCPYVSLDGPIAKGSVSEARELFDLEYEHGTFRYFEFCGHCLVEHRPNYGREPTSRERKLAGNLRQRLEDLFKWDGRTDPIRAAEVIASMKRYGSGDLTPSDLKWVIQLYAEGLGDGEPDYSRFVLFRSR